VNYPKINLSPTVRISIGLIALMAGWMMLLDLLIGIMPDQKIMVKELRERTSENLAIQSTVLIQAGDIASLKKTLDEAVHRDTKILSVAIRKKNGNIALQAGNHQKYWQPLDETDSTLDFVRVGIKANNQLWGNLEIAFVPASPKTFLDWLRQPTVISFILLILGGLVLYSFYLRKVFVYLDPSSVIPDRVSAAFDAFSVGVMMVDKTGRIMLANKALRQWGEEENSKLFGKSSESLPWLKTALHAEHNNYPWIKAMDMQETIKGWHMDFQQSSGESIKAIVNCSPIMDADNNIRGCLVTFDNVTELDRINKDLTITMEKLNKSQEEIKKQNVDLRNLATRDPLTNCLNRRAFFELADPIFDEFSYEKRPLSCIMSDIDHFKLFNDKYGHAIGDKVLISVSRSLFRGLRIEDLLTRYGGEEFCILLPDATPEVALSIAERLRLEIESQAGSSIRGIQAIKVTSSFGVATLNSQTQNLAALIDQADKALYAAKNSGRNCVKVWGDGE
jgi:diguanylate cyclase (GGDEF)-like protein